MTLDKSSLTEVSKEAGGSFANVDTPEFRMRLSYLADPKSEDYQLYVDSFIAFLNTQVAVAFTTGQQQGYNSRETEARALVVDTQELTSKLKSLVTYGFDGTLGGDFGECDKGPYYMAKDVHAIVDTVQEVSVPVISVQAEESMEHLQYIGELLRTQDNRMTDAPLFVVQQKRIYVTEEGYNDSRVVWCEDDGDYGEVSEERAARLERVYRARGEEPNGYKRLAVMDVWEFVTACFTEQGCQDYLNCNGHNLREPRIYAEGSYRNREFRNVRNWLMSLPANLPDVSGA